MSVFKKHGTGQSCEDIAPIHRRVYVNVGCWNNGRTDFALVHEDEVVLCSWMNFLGDRERKIVIDKTAKYDDINEVEINSEKIKAILNDSKAQKKPYWAKPTILAYTSLPSCHRREDKKLLFTDVGDDVYVFIGDLHLNLFLETPLDAFTVSTPQLKSRGLEPKAKGFRHSLDPYFSAFIDYLKDVKGVPTDHIIQCGDCYEVWHTQLIFDQAYDFICKHDDDDEIMVYSKAKKTVRIEKSSGERWEMPDYQLSGEPPHLGKAAFNKWLGCNGWTEWHEKATIEKALLLALNETLDEKAYFASWIDWWGRNRGSYNRQLRFHQVTEVEKAIRDFHPLLNNIWKKLKIIQGNHDTRAENVYFSLRYLKKRNDEALSTGWVEIDRAQRELPYKTGLDESIVYEHGNRFDEFNNDQNYYRQKVNIFSNIFKGNFSGNILPWNWDAGFAKTGDYIANIMQGSILTRSFKDWVAGGPLVKYARSLKNDLYEEDNESHRIRLVVLGHTHVPELENVECEVLLPAPVSLEGPPADGEEYYGDGDAGYEPPGGVRDGD